MTTFDLPPIDPMFTGLMAVPTPTEPLDDEPWDEYDPIASEELLSGDQATVGTLLPAPSNPMAVARALLPEWHHRSILILRNWRGTWQSWEGPHWVELDDAAMRAHLYPRLEHAQYEIADNKGKIKLVSWAPTRTKIANLNEAVAAITHLASSTEMPSWLAGHGVAGGGGHVVACRNGLLDIETRVLHPLTPLYFNRISVPFDYDAAASPPTRWLNFLKTIWPEDPEAVAAVQEFFGYVLSGRTDLQKMMLIIGPTRSGKGTIARILKALVGADNMAGPTLAGIATNFGLSTLVGKSLAIISDARLPHGSTEVVVERLLSISGEDTLDVDRKYKDLWTGRIPARFLILSNELPAFADASGAIANRLIVLTMVTSFLGKEDTTLDGDLNKELPGILNWSLDGLANLTKRGRFLEPASSAGAVATLSATVSPIKAFLAQCCTEGPEESVTTDLLWQAWRDWCDRSGRDRKGTRETFGRNLLAAIPTLSQTRPLVNGVKVRKYQGVSLGVDDFRD